MSNSNASRRVFLKVLGAGSVSLGATAVIGCGGDDPTEEPASDVAAGNVSSLPEGTLRPVSGQPVAIGRDAGGVYAMTLICTHTQCDMRTDGTVAASGLVCSCHGSEFDGNGAVTKGPATKPLDHYAVEIDAEGEMTIKPGSVVSADARTAVPTAA